jgi:ubiquinone/menaquinone biosynthesis C-methylase UbiE
MNPSDAAEPFTGPGRREAKDIKSIMRGYDALMSKVYDFLTCWFMAPLIRESHLTLLEHMDQARAERLLDIGCGTGTLMAMEGMRAPSDLIVGLDLSIGMLDRARRKLAKAGLRNRTELVLGDAEALPFRSSSFGACTCTGTLRFIPDPALALRQALLVLRGGGSLGVREMVGGRTPMVIRHIPLPFKASFVVWRLLPERWMEMLLRSAGFEGVTSFRSGMVPQFIIAMGPPIRRYAFFFASKPCPQANLPHTEEPIAPRVSLVEASVQRGFLEV